MNGLFLLTNFLRNPFQKRITAGNITIAIAFCSLLLISPGCQVSSPFATNPSIVGNGTIRSKTIPLESFRGIILAVAYDVEIICREGAPELVLTSDENLQEFLWTRLLPDGKLFLWQRTPSNGASIVPSVRPKLRIYAPLALERIEARGNSRTYIRGLETKSFSISVASNDFLEVRGKTDKCDIVGIGPNTEINTKALNCNDMDINVMSNLLASVYSEKSLKAQTFNSYITYFGNPPTTNKTIRGTGNIVKGD